VILPPPGTVGSGEVRGGAPATREFDLLDPVRLVDRIDAGEGFPTPLGPVPIVVGMSLFDASVATSPPDASSGEAALLDALSDSDEPFLTGRVGAGTGAYTGKWRSRTDPGGLGIAYGKAGPASVVVIVAVNAWGDVITPSAPPVSASDVSRPDVPFGRGNTTIAVVLTDARLSKRDCFLLAQSGHTGFARAIHPAHSRYDGDAVVALATGELSTACEGAGKGEVEAGRDAPGGDAPGGDAPGRDAPGRDAPGRQPAADDHAPASPGGDAMPPAGPGGDVLKADLDLLRAVAAEVTADAIRSAVRSAGSSASG
jgi:L-aminopeptidase/D-esterase-like protein